MPQTQTSSRDVRYDVLGIGNAIVDMIASADEALLHREGIAKGGMMLIDEARAAHLYGVMGPATITSGGSAANTIVGVASLGGRAAYIGKVKADEVGAHFVHDIRASGVSYATAQASDGPITAACYIFVTPDGERTMNTFLGASQNLSTADIDEALVASAAITYLEGYLWDPPAAKDAFRTAAKIAHAHGREVALTLSDSFCVDRYRAEFLDLIRSGMADIVFANESELKSLYETSDFDSAVVALREDAKLGVVTRGELGSVIVGRDRTVAVPAARIDTLVDTTGAGDLFAAGFLHGYTRGADHETSARLGGLAAAHIIQKIGARPGVSLKELAEQNGLSV
ncbi:MAG: adenosine kinase [Beijerinckiaceae bacterium]|nr:adenosine kinase [Beijerinckiaceae bacterium]